MNGLLLSLASLALFGVQAFAQEPPAPPLPPLSPGPPSAPGPVSNVFFYQAAPVDAIRKMAHPVTNAPYQAQSVSESTQHLADGNVIQTSHTSKVARDGQGRTWTEQTLDKMGPWSSDSGPHTIVFINDPVANASYVLHPDTKTAEKIMSSKDGVVMFDTAGPGMPPPGGGGGVAVAGHSVTMMTKRMDEAGMRVVSDGVANGDATDLGTQEINGVSAQGKRITSTIPANTIGNQQPIVSTSETWFSPELQVVVQSKHDDPRFGETTYSLTNIQKGEPPADLFQVPGDYTVTSGPSKPVLSFQK